MTTNNTPARLLLDALTLTAAWGGDRLEVSCDRCPLIDWIEAAEECSRF